MSYFSVITSRFKWIIVRRNFDYKTTVFGKPAHRSRTCGTSCELLTVGESKKQISSKKIQWKCFWESRSCAATKGVGRHRGINHWRATVVFDRTAPVEDLVPYDSRWEVAEIQDTLFLQHLSLNVTLTKQVPQFHLQTLLTSIFYSL